MSHQHSAEFAALAETVADMQRRGRVTRTAGVKPELIRHLAGSFDERALGYRTFSQFAEEAARQGYVEFGADADGWRRIRVSGDAPRGRGPGRGPERLRPDIWNAFIEWRTGSFWVWDRASGRAVKLADTAPAKERDDLVGIRAAWEEKSEAVVAIPPVPQQEQLAWVRAFVDELGEHPLANPLRTALDDPRPFLTAGIVLRADVALKARYHHYRLGKVLAAVRNWAAEHQIDLDAIDHSSPPPAPSAVARLDGRGGTEIEALRKVVRDAADQMTLEQLRRIELPLGIVFDSLR